MEKNNIGSYDDVKFQYCVNFINSREILPISAMNVFINVCSSPIEQVIYNGVINVIPEDASYHDYVKEGARLYYLQSRLNMKIGRTSYNYGSKDEDLLRYIFSEMKRRRKNVFEDLKASQKRQEFMEDVYQSFLDMYPVLCNDFNVNINALLKAIKLRCNDKDVINADELIGFLNQFSSTEDLEEDETENDYYAYMMKCLIERGWVKTEHELMKKELCIRRESFRTKPPNKNELYYFCVACGFTMRQFEKLRSLLQKNKTIDPKQYIDIDVNGRDSKIQSVFMDINGWIYGAFEKTRNNQNLPSQLVKDVNIFLAKNGYRDMFDN